MNKTAVALGTFDGVHAGHKVVLEAAANSGLYSVAVAFRVPPKYFLKGEGVVITDQKTKTTLIKKSGIKKIDYIDFLKVKEISAEDFFYSIKEKYNPAVIVCGYNYSFGNRGLGNTNLLKSLCDKENIKLKIIQKVSVNGDTVSSSRIRNLLSKGEVYKANGLLYEDFSICAKVIHGDKRGRKINFNTFNQRYPEKKTPIKYGVYLTKTEIDGKFYFGMTNVGIRPTYPLKKPICETNLFDFTGDLYGKNLRIYFLQFIREEKKFSDLSELQKAIDSDKQEILKIIKNLSEV